MDEKVKSSKLLVTVGTTEFDQLIYYTSSSHFLELLSRIGVGRDEITYQIGSTGTIIPENGQHLRLSPNIQDIYDAHDMILTHGGAGTLLCCLAQGKPGKKIVAIANDTLAGNHQIELIRKLNSEGYLLGFNSMKQLQQNESKLIQFLRGEVTLKQYKKPQRCLLNDLILNKKE